MNLYIMVVMSILEIMVGELNGDYLMVLWGIEWMEFVIDDFDGFSSSFESNFVVYFGIVM